MYPLAITCSIQNQVSFGTCEHSLSVHFVVTEQSPTVLIHILWWILSTLSISQCCQHSLFGTSNIESSSGFLQASYLIGSRGCFARSKMAGG